MGTSDFSWGTNRALASALRTGKEDKSATGLAGQISTQNMEPGAGLGLHWEFWSTALVEAGSKANHFLGLLKFRNMKLKKKKKKAHT